MSTRETQTWQTWHPWQEMQRLQREMERLLGGGASARGTAGVEYPPVNLIRGDQEITLEALCPGLDRGALDVSVVGDSVTLRGERKPEPEVAEERYHRRERPIGAFIRTIGLGERLDANHTHATYANGILRVQLARAPETQPKKIPIQTS